MDWQAAGLSFDANGDLYIAEQDFDRIWRIRFAAVSEVPGLSLAALVALAVFLALAAGVVVGSEPGAL